MKIFSLLTLLLFTFCIRSVTAADLNRYAFTLEVAGRSGGTYFGTGCLVKHGDDTYYITDRHIFQLIKDSDLIKSLSSFTIVNKADQTLRLKPEAFLSIPDVQAPSIPDFLILRVKSSPLLDPYTLTVAASAPEKDETVYLTASLPKKSLATYPLKILEANKEKVSYEKISDVESYAGVSGAPIINAKGELVGTFAKTVMRKKKQHTTS